MVEKKKPLRILQVLPELNEGGVERGVMEMNRELVARGVDSFVMSKGGHLVDQILKDGGSHIELDVCSKNPFTVPKRVLSLRRVLQEIGPSIVHARSRVPAWLCRFAKRSTGIPFVTTVHGMNSANAYSAVMVSGDRVICVGEPVKHHVLWHYRPNPDKITVIPRGVDLSAFDPARVEHIRTSALREEFGLGKTLVIGSVGRISLGKDFETVIAAIGLLVDDFPQVRGLIVGGVSPNKGAYAESLREFAEERCPGSVVFAGSRTDMPETYACCDLVVNASPRMGNVARTILEALAMNIPVLSTRLEGLEQLVRDGVNGYVFRTGDPDDLASKIRLLLKNPPLRPRESIPPEFTLESMVDATLSIYRSLAS